MAMYTVVVKANGASDVVIEDLGIAIPGSGQVTVSDQYTFDELAGSDDLRAAIGTGDGTVTINDGSSDLAAADGVKWLTLDNRKNTEDNHYTKTQMQSSGQAEIHWDNVSNAPSFGSPNWLEPVVCRVLAIQAGTGGLTPVDGDFYVDTTNSPDELYKYTTAWAKVRDVAVGDRFIKLDEADEAIFEYESDADTPVDQGAPSDNDAVVLDDDGDGKQSQYVYNATGTTWTKIGDVDFGPHLDGGSNKHDASEIDVEGTYTHIATGDLEAAIEDIDDELIALNAAIPTSFNTLDEAYDEGGAGAGRTINADSGSVKIDPTSTNAGLELVPKASAPSTDLAGGQFHIDSATGILYVYDATRSLWLSVERFMLAFGEKGPVKDRHLAHYIGVLKSNNAGLRMIRNACIVGAAGQLDASGTCNMRIRRNDVATNLATLAVTAAVGAQDGALNVSLTAGDYLQAYLDASVAVEDPTLLVEIAWRL